MEFIKIRLSNNGKLMFPTCLQEYYYGILNNGAVTVWFEKEYSSFGFSINDGDYEIIERKEIDLSFQREKEKIIVSEHREDLLHVVDKFFEHINNEKR